MANIVVSPKWDYRRTIKFNTVAQETASQQSNVYVSNARYPVWCYKWEIPLLRGRMDDTGSAVAQVAGLFCNARGQAGTFLFNDPRDNSVVNANFGTGDSASKTFQLVRSIGGNFNDIVQNLNGAPHIFIAGVEQLSGFTIDSNGVVTFGTAPTTGAALTWTGNFYFRLRFKSDELEFQNFVEGAWSNQMELESVIL